MYRGSAQLVGKMNTGGEEEEDEVVDEEEMLRKFQQNNELSHSRLSLIEFLNE